MKADLDEVIRELTQPPHPAITTSIRTAIQSGQRPRRSTTNWSALVAIGLVPLIIAASVGGVLWLRGHQQRDRAVPAASGLPQPVPQPITRTSAAAQVAWLVSRSAENQTLMGVDPTGKIVGSIPAVPTQGVAAPYGFWRSGDGASIFTAGTDALTSYSALDGSRLRTYGRLNGTILADAFSRDGRWLALLVQAQVLTVQLIDLSTGSTQERAIQPGQAGLAGPGTGVIFFAGDSRSLVALTGWAGPSRLTLLKLSAGGWDQALTTTEGGGGVSLPTCKGPAMGGEISDNTLVGFCHADGAIWFIDLTPPHTVVTLGSHQRNPFWLSPIFSPDGHLLYLHQWPAFGDAMQVVDLRTRRQLGPVPTPFDLKSKGPFGWLITDVSAGGVASTVPISPDGLKIYSAGPQGVVQLRVPDLKPLRLLAPGIDCEEVWVSGDGQTLFALPRAGGSVIIFREDGTGEKRIALPGATYLAFSASEHG